MSRGDYHRWNAKRTTDSYHGVSLASLKRLNMLSPGRHSMRWSRNGEKTGSIGFVVSEDAVTFQYTNTECGGEQTKVDQKITLTKTIPHYGGERNWFLCGCGRRVTTVYIGKHVACRHCFRLSYQSRNESCPINRQWRKIRKLEARLGGDEWRRPKWMHEQTFNLIRWKLQDAHMRKDEIFIGESMRRFPNMF